MITKNPMQLKAIIKRVAQEKGISAQLVMQNYMLERLLERIAISEYKYNFILKGGFLISAIVGLDTRATMDLDTTIKGFDLTHEAVREIFSEFCSIDINDDVCFELKGTLDIREADDYPGIRLSLNAKYEKINVPLTVDITTSDIITPREIKYTIPFMFDEGSINILAYNIETILAEKIETILSRGIANTRTRDFYDIYILHVMRWEECNLTTLKEALFRTAEKRNSNKAIQDYLNIITSLKTNKQLHDFWSKYQRNFDYAKNIAFDDACDTILQIMDDISRLYKNF